MRIRVRHETRYRYEQPARGLAQTLRLTPRSFEGQYVVGWRTDLSLDLPAPLEEDPFGNLVQTVFAKGPLQEFVIEVEGEVETFDCGGIVRGAPDPLPPDVFLRPTPLTQPSAELRAFIGDVAAPEGDPLSRLHALMGAIHREVRFDLDATHAATRAADAFAARAGVCQDLAQIFVTGARLLGLPARYVSGHLMKVGEAAEQDAGHAWAEALVPDLGWVAFDPTNGVCAGEAHVRVATGFDSLSAAPVRGVRTGGTGEALTVAVEVANLDQARLQSSD